MKTCYSKYPFEKYFLITLQKLKILKTVLSKNSDSLKTKFLTKQFLKKSKVLEKCKKIIDLKILKKCFNNDTAIETMFKKIIEEMF